MAMFSTRARYAIHGLAYVAAQAGERRLVPFREIRVHLEDYAGETAVSAGYIAKIMQEVSRSGLCVGGTGPRGGYRLMRPPGEVTLLDVVEAVDGPLSSGCCLMAIDVCPGADECTVRDALNGAEEATRQALRGHTLADLARGVPRQAAAGRTASRR